MNEFFRKVAQKTSQMVGTSWAFLIAILTVVVWAATGPMFHYSDTWQLVINTGTTVVTFLMVFLIQSSQNRDTRAIHIKLDEIIRVQKSARNSLINLEEMTDEDLDRIQAEFSRLHQREVQRNGGVPPAPESRNDPGT
jgi:low affinity Fe/Cu permease